MYKDSSERTHRLFYLIVVLKVTTVFPLTLISLYFFYERRAVQTGNNVSSTGLQNKYYGKTKTYYVEVNINQINKNIYYKSS